MSLSVIDLQISIQALPPEAAALVEQGRQRAEAFYSQVTDQPPGGFLAGDYELIYSALALLRESDILPGLRFCEWGSGVGVILGLAAQLGYEPSGIELQSELTQESQRWLSKLGLDALAALCAPRLRENPAARPWPFEGGVTYQIGRFSFRAKVWEASAALSTLAGFRTLVGDCHEGPALRCTRDRLEPRCAAVDSARPPGG